MVMLANCSLFTVPNFCSHGRSSSKTFRRALKTHPIVKKMRLESWKRARRTSVDKDPFLCMDIETPVT